MKLITSTKRFLMAFLCCVFAAQTACADASPSRADAIQALEDYEKAKMEWRQNFKGLGREEAMKKYEEVKDSRPDPFVAFESAKTIYTTEPADADGFEAMMFVVQEVGAAATQLDNQDVLKEVHGVFTLMAKHHSSRAEVINPIRLNFFGGTFKEQTHQLVEAVLAGNGDKELKGAVYLELASAISNGLKPGMPAEEVSSALGKIEHYAAIVNKDYSDTKIQYGPRKISLKERIDGIVYATKNLSSGSEVPDLAIQTVNGEADTLSNHRGKVVLLDFWATWCQPCVAAIPGLIDLKKDLADRPFEIISISVDEDVDTVLDFMEDQDMPWVNWFAGPEHPMLAKFNIQQFPTYILVAPDGNVMERPLNFGDEEKTKLKKLLGVNK